MGENRSKRGSPETGRVDPVLDLGDGNADEEAEKLIPGPNFLVLRLFNSRERREGTRKSFRQVIR